MTKAREERERTGAWYGLKPGALYWNSAGQIVCSACSVPYPGSDTWQRERWAEVTADDKAAAKRLHRKVLKCEDCEKAAYRSAIALSKNPDWRKARVGLWAIERLNDPSTDPKQVMDHVAKRVADLEAEASR